MVEVVTIGPDKQVPEKHDSTMADIGILLRQSKHRTISEPVDVED